MELKPIISIITVNYNNGSGLAATIESVLNQRYSNIEFLVIDGGSTDESRGVLAKFKDRIHYQVSERDKGIYNAMNKGIVKASGDYLLFLNSGDYLYTRDAIGDLAAQCKGEDLLYGNMMINEPGGLRRQVYPSQPDFLYFISGRSLPHHATFIRRSLFDRVGMYNEAYKLVSDWEFFLNAVCLFSATYQYHNIDVAVYQLDGISSQPENAHYYEKETSQTIQRFYHSFLPLLNERKQLQREIRLMKSSRVYRVALALSGFFRKSREPINK